VKRCCTAALLLASFLASCSARSATLDPTAGKDDPEPEYAFVFDGTLVRDYHLDVAPADLALMDNETYVRGTFQCGAETLGDVGVRYKGNSSYFSPGPKKSFKVDFNLYVAGQNFHGFKKLNFNNNFKDPSMMREKLGYDLHLASGVPAPRTAHANLYLNGVLQGVYTLVQQVDKTFLRTHFGDDSGNLFKATGFDCSLTYLGSDPALYMADYELKTNEIENDYTGFVQLVHVLNNTPDAQFQAEIETVFHVDPFLSWLAVDTMLSHLDNYSGTGHNYYLYHNPGTGRFEFIPWDANEEFGNFRGGWTADEMLTLDIYQPFRKPPQPPALHAVSGTGPGNVLASGDFGSGTRFNGTLWTPFGTGTNRRLNGIWCNTPIEAVAVGDAGEIRRFNGAVWNPEPSGTVVRLNGVWGTGSANVIAVGEQQTILRWNGASWSLENGGAGPPLFAVWGSGASDIFAVGAGPIHHYNGSTWSSQPPPYPPPPPLPPAFFGIWGSAWNDVFAVGEGGAVIRFNGTNWNVMASGTTEFLRGVWGSSGNDVFAVGENGTILRYNGANWAPMSSGTTEHLEGVWGNGAGDVFTVGTAGTVLHYNGSAWTPQDGGFTVPAPAPRPLITRILNVPAYRTAYEDKLRALLSGPFAQSAMNAEIDALYALIRPSVYSDTMKMYTDQEFDDSIAQDIPPIGPNRILGLKPFVTQRRASVQSQLP